MVSPRISNLRHRSRQKRLRICATATSTRLSMLARTQTRNAKRQCLLASSATKYLTAPPAQSCSATKPAVGRAELMVQMGPFRPRRTKTASIGSVALKVVRINCTVAATNTPTEARISMTRTFKVRTTHLCGFSTSTRRRTPSPSSHPSTSSSSRPMVTSASEVNLMVVHHGA